MEQAQFEATLLRDLREQYSLILSVADVAEILKENCPAVRARIRRGTFPVRVLQTPGNPQHVLLVDLIKFLVTGESQIASTNSTFFAGASPRRRGRPRLSQKLDSQGAP